MKQKLFLTSIAAIMLATPAFATVGDAIFTENQTNQPSCQIDILGVDENTANANATWSVNSYTCPAGTYLPDGDTWSSDSQYGNDNCAACTAGSYCAGGTLQYSEANDVGITACPSGYTNSAANATAQSQCYRTCAAADVPHLKSGGTMTGGYYYGDNNQCGPANAQQCAGGYHYVAAAPDLMTVIGASEGGTAYGYLSNTGEDSYNTSTYGITHNGEFVVDYGNKGKVHGYARCSSRSATNSWVGSNGDYVLQSDGTTATLPDSTGQYCYCQLDGYTANGSQTTIALSAPWVFRADLDGAMDCAYDCAFGCATSLSFDSSNLTFRAAVFGAIPAGPASCQANTITLNWKNATGGTHATTTCTYGGTIDTPTTAPTKRGHTFTGWHFVAPSNN